MVTSWSYLTFPRLSFATALAIFYKVQRREKEQAAICRANLHEHYPVQSQVATVGRIQVRRRSVPFFSGVRHPNASAFGRLGSPCFGVLSVPNMTRFCIPCQRYVHESNNHCVKCGICPSKDGRQYIHCQQCNTCVKPGRSHCSTCRRCQVTEILFMHSCLRSLDGMLDVVHHAVHRGGVD